MHSSRRKGRETARSPSDRRCKQNRKPYVVIQRIILKNVYPISNTLGGLVAPSPTKRMHQSSEAKVHKDGQECGGVSGGGGGGTEKTRLLQLGREMAAIEDNISL